MNQHLERLDGVAVFLKRPVLELVAQCERRLKRKLLIVYGWRSMQSQMLIYAEGRTFDRASGEWTVTDPRAIRTKAKPGTSAHNVIARDGQPAAVGIDIIPMDVNGSPEWGIGDAFWDDLYDLAWTVGLDPLGDPIGSYLAGDKGHFQEPGWELKLDGLGLILPHEEVVL